MVNQAPAVAPEQIMFRQKDHLRVLPSLFCVVSAASLELVFDEG